MIEFNTITEKKKYTIVMETDNYLFYKIMQGVARALVDAENAARKESIVESPEFKKCASFAKGGAVVGVDLSNSQDMTVDAGEIIAPCDPLKAAIQAAFERDFKRGYMNDK